MLPGLSVARRVGADHAAVAPGSSWRTRHSPYGSGTRTPPPCPGLALGAPFVGFVFSSLLLVFGAWFGGRKSRAGARWCGSFFGLDVFIHGSRTAREHERCPLRPRRAGLLPVAFAPPHPLRPALWPASPSRCEEPQGPQGGVERRCAGSRWPRARHAVGRSNLSAALHARKTNGKVTGGSVRLAPL